jgi:anti-sigma B factor antagonist
VLMEIRHDEVAPGVVAVVLSGRVTMGPASEQIVTLILELLHQGKRTIIFDLAGVTSLDSTGIGRFISSYKMIKAAGGEMRMAGATGHFFDVFHISRLDTVFPFYATAEEAAEG